MAIGQFILMAASGLHPSDRGASGAAAILSRLPGADSNRPPLITSVSALGDTGAPEGPMAVIDTVFDDGPKLVEMHDHAARALTAGAAPVRAAAVADCPLPLSFSAATAALAPPGLMPSAGAAPGPGMTFVLVCVDAVTGAPVPGCQALAFDDYAARTGGAGMTGADGRVALSIQGPLVEWLCVAGPAGYRNAWRSAVTPAPGGEVVLPLQPIDLDGPFPVRALYGRSRFQPDAGVVVGIIDSGIGPHPDLNIVGLHNTVCGEPAGAGDDWLGHGTHLAGLIGGGGKLRGLAPGVALRGYRAFGRGAGAATSYAILKALVRAAADGCDIVLLSLGGRGADDTVREALAHARDQGVLVIVPAGGSLAFPAFPGSAGQDALTAPGVVSTLPGGLYGAMSGPAVDAALTAGAAACLLSHAPEILAVPRGRERSAAAEVLMLDACVGHLPDPAKL